MKQLKRPIFNQPRQPRLVLIGMLLVLCYIVIYWHRLLLKGMIPFDGDTFRLVYPTWFIGKELLKNGLYFLWEPYRNMGQPFLASPSSQALYPLRFVSLFVNFLDYERISVVFHTLLASGFASCLVWRWHQNRASALLAAIGMGFNGFVLARATVRIDFASMAWVPAVLFFLDSRRPILLGISLCLQWMAGFPPFSIITAILLIIFASASAKPLSALICLIKGGGIAAGLSAIQILPFLEMLREAGRPLFFPDFMATQFSVHPVELVKQLFLPSFIAPNLAPLTDSDPAVTSFYLGPFLIVLFLIGLVKGKRREKILGVSGILAFVLALGHYNGFYAHIPFITIFRYPAHWLLLAISFLVLVACSSLKHLAKPKLGLLITALITGDLLLYALPLRSAWGDLEFLTKQPILAQDLNPIPTDKRIFHAASITEQVHTWKIQSKEDWVAFRAMLIPSIGVPLGFREVASRHQLTSLRHHQFLERLGASSLDSPLFDYAGVATIVALTREGSEKPMPMLEDCVALPNVNAYSRVFMETGQPAHVLEDHPGRITFKAEGPGRVIVSESYFPGWRVYKDGEKHSPETFEKVFLATTLSSGTHHIQFSYEPLSFKLGALISILTVFGIGIYLILSGRWAFSLEKIRMQGRRDGCKFTG